MSGWEGFTPLEPVCVDCGAQLAPWTGALSIGDPRDDREARCAGNALAIQTHRHAAHRIEPSVGDLVRYAQPWRGHVLVSDVYRVDAIRPGYDAHEYAREMGAVLEPLIVTRYGLTDPHRSTNWCVPDVGDPLRPVTFEIVDQAPPVEDEPPVELDLMDLLGWVAS